MDITLKPIGFVTSPVKQPPGPGFDWEQISSEIVLDAGLVEALDGIEEFSHIIVLYWMHLLTPPLALKVHPRRNPALPLVGLFATRSPSRPNPIGLSIARLAARRDNLLIVSGLDAVDGTPVLDIKPYIPGSDSVPEAKVPSWLT